MQSLGFYNKKKLPGIIFFLRNVTLYDFVT